MTNVHTSSVSLSLSSLLYDHALLRGLLLDFENTPTPDRRKRVMRLALDFFDLHSEAEETLFHLQEPQADHDALEDLAEMLELTSPDSQLYFARGLEFSKYLREHMRDEERLFPRPARDHSILVDPRLPLLRRHQALMGEIRNTLDRPN